MFEGLNILYTTYPRDRMLGREEVAKIEGGGVLSLRERNTLSRSFWDMLLDTESLKHCIQATARRFRRDRDAVDGVEARESRSDSGKAWQRLILG